MHGKFDAPEKPLSYDVLAISAFYVAKAFQKPTAEAYLIKAGFKDQTIKVLYALPFEATKSMKLSMFQFKINHNILTPENFLKLKLRTVINATCAEKNRP